MRQGLFESLTGEFIDGTPVDAIPQERRRVVSIMDHLNRMFNTRQGSVSHLKDYGLPDVSDIYRRMPDGIGELREALKRTVERHEPRLANVRVVQRDTDSAGNRLAFIVTGDLRDSGNRVRFQTTFTSIGESSIAPWQRPGA
ncbi:MAG: type VI secretion system baseplate subunit TssE [Chitinivibrionales bacterium]|nr:type VI secretion system baseplate subunit TssE [Chitinivibrionales bacterium]MBD3394002.1 type VI secretion system baseplate subunit TssE [Chitinivibrionales bacterium]